MQRREDAGFGSIESSAVDPARELISPGFYFFYCTAYTPALTLMSCHVLPQLAPGVFHNLAISLRAAVTCAGQTRAANTAGEKKEISRRFFLQDALGAIQRSHTPSV